MRGSGLLCSHVHLKKQHPPKRAEVLTNEPWMHIYVYVIEPVLCAGFSLCYVQCLVCVMCSLWSGLCAVFSLCYVRVLVPLMCGL